MAISSLVARVSCLLTYENRLVKQVLASVDAQGNIAVNDSSGHEEVVREAEDDLGVWTAFSNNAGEFGEDLEALVAGAGPGVTATLVAAATPETVTDMVVEISGTAAYDDNTQVGFVFQYQNGVWSVPLKENTTLNAANTDVVAMLTTWAELLTDALAVEPLNDLVALFEAAGLTLA